MQDADCYVLGGGSLGTVVTRRLQEDGHAVRLVDESRETSETPGLDGDPSEIATLKEAGISDSSTVVVGTPHDSQNLLIAQLVSTNFDVPRVVVLANDPTRLDLLASAGHEPVCATTALSDAIVDSI